MSLAGRFPWILVGFGFIACSGVGFACASGTSPDEDTPSAGTTSSGQGGAGAAGGNGGEGGMGSGGEGGGPPPCDTTQTPEESSCVLTDDLGIFVRNEGSDSAAGTRDEPVATLGKAIELAAAQGKRIYACDETFSEAVEIPLGIEIYGGLDCATDWKWTDAAKTTVEGAPDQVPVRLLGGEMGTTRLVDVTVVAADAATPGGSSIAMIADGAKAELLRCELVAGVAMAGDAGASGPAGPAATGPNGNDGLPGCVDADVTPGGPAVLNPVCNSTAGGKGGDGTDLVGLQGDFGVPGGAPGGSADGVCTLVIGSGFGTSGTDGLPGMAGTAGVGIGAISASGYEGVPGGDGLPGEVGNGGGGGCGRKGGGMGACSTLAGASGGGGGAGGCGGVAGKGGLPGGSSIALISLSANVSLTECTVKANTAGDGGQGGDGQIGGNGGGAGLGGVSMNGQPNACPGGLGGKGGDGGPGGGGSGGHSIAIAFTGAMPTQFDVTLMPGTAGVGGLGGTGDGGGAANQGSQGTAADTLEL